jgi:integrase/recombinase XerD
MRDLCVSSVDLDSKQIMLKGKGGHERKLPIPDALTPLIAALMYNQSGDAYLLRGAGGGYWSKDSFYKWFNRHAAMCGLPDETTPYHLRHTVATALASVDGLNVYNVRDWLGHKSIRTTEVYVHTSGHKMSHAMENHPLHSTGETL